MKELQPQDYFLVGGAVRDKLLGLEVKERDWVVVGKDPAFMYACGFTSVGRDFPVFLHPETKEEYALARTERKTAIGYHGFEFNASPDVSLEDDLYRRDLTINAIAENHDGQLVDPYQGQKDLDNRYLRHISPAFAEDPVRILRVARFSARYSSLGFKVADETNALMRSMTQKGEVDALVAERVWQELAKALTEPHPHVFFEVLKACDALPILFPEIAALFGVPQKAQWHPEVDTGIHTMMVLQQAAKCTQDPVVRFASLCHDLGKGSTPADLLPSHHGHETRGLALVKALCKRYRAPKQYRELALIATEYHTHCHRAFELKPQTIAKLLKNVDALRRPERFEQFLLCCESDAKGRLGFEQSAYPQADYLRQAFEVYRDTDITPATQQPVKGPEIAQQIEQLRTASIRQFVTAYRQEHPR